jgi:hypothetical protein
MMVKKLISSLLIFQLGLSLIFATPQISNAFDAKATHRGTEKRPGLTMKAIDLKLKEHNPDDPNAPAPDPEFYNTFSNPDVRKLIEQGSEEEDYPEPGTFLSYGYALRGLKRQITSTTLDSQWQGYPFMYHFYNPKAGKGLFSRSDNKASDFFKEYFNKAIEYHEGTNCQPPNYEKAFYVLGRALHLIEDMATPAHVMRELHGPGDPDDFELYAMKEDVLSRIMATQSVHLSPLDNPVEKLASETLSEVELGEDEIMEIYGDRYTTEIVSRPYRPPIIKRWIEGVGPEDGIWYQVGEDENGKPLYYIADGDEVLKERFAERLLPRAVEYVAGAINEFWERTKTIYEIVVPGCDHPDDNSSVSTPEVEAITFELEAMLSSYYRLAIKKDKKSILSYQKLLEEYKKYLELAQTGR